MCTYLTANCISWLYSHWAGNGIYLGGLRQAQEMIQNGIASPKDFKFFFNYVEWGPQILEKEVADGRWDVVAVPPDIVLAQSTSSTWRKIRGLLQL